MSFDVVALALSFVAVDQATTVYQNDGAAIVSAFKGATFEVYEERRKALVAQLVTSGKSVNEGAAGKMFQRVMDALGITKPKSASKKAQDMAASREAAKNEKLALLASLGVTPESTSADVMKAIKKSTPSDVKAVALAFSAEKAKQEEDEKQKAEKAKKDDVRKKITAALRNAPFDVIQQVAELLHVVPPSVKTRRRK